MKCPVCDTTLRAIERYGVELDICPGCKGVWLDRGELEKIIELEAAGGPVQAPATRDEREAPRRSEESRRRDDDDDDDDDRRREPQYDQQDRPHRKKRGSWFGEIFEMFGD